MQANLLSQSPMPVWLVRAPENAPTHAWYELLMKMDPELALFSFRGVSIERVGVVLRTGIDIEPSTAVIFLDCIDKALEYGGWPKLVLDWTPTACNGHGIGRAGNAPGAATLSVLRP